MPGNTGLTSMTIGVIMCNKCKRGLAALELEPIDSREILELIAARRFYCAAELMIDRDPEQWSGINHYGNSNNWWYFWADLYSHWAHHVR